MYFPQKYYRDKHHSIFLGTLLLFFVLFLFLTISSLADNNGFIIHQVTKGDTLWNISRKYNTSLELILAYNNIKEKDILSLGQLIKIPHNNLQPTDDIIHIVKKGETLWLISRIYNLEVDSIRAINNIPNPELISVGQKIKILSTENISHDESLKNQEIVQENKNDSDNQAESLTPVTYVVEAGDNLWNIAQKYGLSVKDITEINNLNDKSLLSIGQKLDIPGIGGGVSVKEEEQEPTIITYTVVKGDNLWSISNRYDVKMTSIISANNLKEISRLSIGQELKIPITDMDIAQAQGYNQETVIENIIYYVRNGDSLWSISRNYNIKLESLIAANNISDASKISTGQRLLIPNVPGVRNNIGNFIWPVRGRITSPYGERGSDRSKEFHAGIDISAPISTNILAAESGIVSYVGYMRGYGNVIILSHNGGYSTVYAHNSVNLVRKGQSVKQGNVIAKVGKTGNATGSHLHFEIRLGGKPLNPLSYLR